MPKNGGKGAWAVCRFKGGLGKKERGGAFEVEERNDTQCTLSTFLLKQHIANETYIKLNNRNLSGKDKVSYIIYRGTKTDDVIRKATNNHIAVFLFAAYLFFHT